MYHFMGTSDHLVAMGMRKPEEDEGSVVIVMIRCC